MILFVHRWFQRTHTPLKGCDRESLFKNDIECAVACLTECYQATPAQNRFI